MKYHSVCRLSFVLVVVLLTFHGYAQPGNITWSKDGNSYFKAENGEIVEYSFPQHTRTVVVSKDKLLLAGATRPLTIRSFSFSPDKTKVLVYTNTKKVWRQDTRGDYWVLLLQKNKLKQLGRSRPPS